MIDVELTILNILKTKLASEFSGLSVYGEEYVELPASFPSVTFEETGNSTYSQTKTSGGKVNHSIITYDIDVYSNLRVGRKNQVKEIFEVIDNEMELLGFEKTFYERLPMGDNLSYRRKAKYTGLVSKDHIVYSF